MQTNDIEDADEFIKPPTTRLVHRQGQQRDNEMQMHILRCLETSGQAGATNKDLVAYLQHHFDPESYASPVSGATSTMHRNGIIVRLARKRGDRVVYMHPDHVPANVETLQPRQKENSMFGTKTKPADSREEVEALQARIKELEHLSTQANEVIDELRDNSEQSANELIAQLRERDIVIQQTNQSLSNVIAERDALSNEMLGHREIQKAALEDWAKKYNEVSFFRNKYLDERDKVIERLNIATQRIAALEGQITASTAEQNRLHTQWASAEKDVHDLNDRVGELQAALDQAEVAAAGRLESTPPRKTFTHDEQRLVEGLAKLLRDKYKSDGTPDNPTRVTLRVSTVRRVLRAIFRVVGD